MDLGFRASKEGLTVWGLGFRLQGFGGFRVRYCKFCRVPEVSTFRDSGISSCELRTKFRLGGPIGDYTAFVGGDRLRCILQQLVQGSCSIPHLFLYSHYG